MKAKTLKNQKKAAKLIKRWSKEDIKAREIVNLDLKPLPGLYLNEENFQTFHVVEVGNSKWAYVVVPEFFDNSEVYCDVLAADLVRMILTGRITYTGEV